MTKNDLARELVKHSAIGWGLAAKVGNRPAGCVQASLHKEIDQQWFARTCMDERQLKVLGLKLMSASTALLRLGIP